MIIIRIIRIHEENLKQIQQKKTPKTLLKTAFQTKEREDFMS